MKSRYFLLVCASAPCVLPLAISNITAADSDEGAASVAVNEARQKNPPLTFRVLDQKLVREGGRTVILNRVAPPFLPKFAMPLAPPALAPEADNGSQEEPQKQQLTLALGVTVYNHHITALRWSGGGKPFIVWSNIDFNCFAGTGRFETQDINCLLLLAIGNESSDVLAENQVKTVPSAEQFSKGGSSYFFAGENTVASCDAKTIAALDALHIYYDAHREELDRAFKDREARRVENERWQREHPPIRQDTVINFWPSENTVFTENQIRKEKP